MWDVVSEREQQGAFEQESVLIRGLRQAIENAPQGKAHQHVIDIETLGLGHNEQRRTDGCRDIRGSRIHPMLSI